MSDTPLSLEQAIGEYVGGTPSEQAKGVETITEEDQTTQEAADLSESDDDSDEQLADGDEAEQDSEDDETGEAVEDDEAEEDDAEEPTFTVIVDGKEEAVSQSELISGYQRQADYTRKTQALTEQRKALETQAEQVGKKYEEAATIMEAVTQTLLGTPPEKPDTQLLYADPSLSEAQNRQRQAKYEQDKANYEHWHVLRERFVQWREGIVQERAKENQGKTAEFAKAEGQKFLEAFKDEVKDDITFNAKIGEIHNYLHGLGYQDGELAGMIDHRAYVVADKARKYDALMADNKPKAELKAKKAKLKPVTSGSAQRKPKRSGTRDQAMKRFEQAASKPGANLNRKELLDSAVDAYMAGQARG